MNIIQKNIFGKNIVYSISPEFLRNLTPEAKGKIINLLNQLDVHSVVIRITNAGENLEYAEIVREFLLANGIQVYQIIPNPFSGYHRKQFTIEKHPSRVGVAIIKIGPLF